MFFRNTASQKAIFFAFDATTNVPKTGDAANITPYVSKDYGAVTAVTDTSATEMDATNAPGYYLVDLTQGETDAEVLLLSAKSATANIKVIGAPATVFPLPTLGVLSPTTKGRTLTIETDGMGHADLKEWLGTAPLALSAQMVQSDVQAVNAGTTAADNLKLAGDAYSATRGLAGTALPAAAADAAGGLIISTAGALNADAQRADITAILEDTGTTLQGVVSSIQADTDNIQTRLPAALVSGRMDSSVGDMAANVLTDAATAADFEAKIADVVWDEIASGHVAAGSFGQRVGLIRANTAAAGGATTITLDGSASAVDNFYNGTIIYLTAGTGVGQARIIEGYVGATKVATVVAWATQPDSTSVFVVIPFGSIPGASAPTAAQVADAVWDEATVGHTTSGTFGEQCKTDIDDILVDTGATLDGRIPSALVGGRMDSSVGAVAANAITAAAIADGAIDAATFAAGAIDAAAIAANAIGASELATDAVSEIQAAVAAGSVASVTGAVGSVTGNVGGSVGSVAAGGIAAASFAAGAIDASAIAADAIGSSELATTAVTEITDAILALTIETGLTLKNALRVIAAAAAGKLSGAATATVVIRNAAADDKNRVTATVDSSGNRSAVSLDLT